jgi:beta-galactosidase
VHLLVKNEISVARNGVYITTPEITDNNAGVAVQVEIDNLNKNKSDIFIHKK